MTTNILPIDNVINVTVSDTPNGLTAKNVNSIAIFTQDAPINNEVFGIYISPSQAASNYGSGSVTSQMVSNIFAQNPNVLSGSGRVVIIPLLATVSATNGDVVSANISANLAGIIASTGGSLGVTINGVTQQLKNLDFSNCVTFSDIAAVLNAQLVNAVATGTSTTVTITSFKVGTGSTVAFAAGSTGTDLDGASYFNGAASTPTNGANSSGETILAAIARTSGLVGYVPLMTTANLEDSAIEVIASGVQALDNEFLHHCASTIDIAGIVTTVSQASQTKTRLLTYCQGQAAANLYKAAYAGRAFSTDFTGSLTASTMNLKTLANVTPDTQISQTLLIAAQTAGTDVYVSYEGEPSVVSTGGNDFFDNPYSDLAAKFALEVAGFNYLRTTNTKIPQTEPGMNGLKNAYRLVCVQFVTNGCWAPGSWTSGEYFGDPTVFANNIANSGYYVYSAPIATQNPTDRQNRKAPLVQIAAKRAGAIQSGDVLVLVNA